LAFYKLYNGVAKGQFRSDRAVSYAITVSQLLYCYCCLMSAECLAARTDCMRAKQA